MALLQPCRAHVTGQGSREPFPALLVHPTQGATDLRSPNEYPAGGTYPCKALSEQITPECINEHLMGRTGSVGKVSVSPMSTAGWLAQAWFMAVVKAT